MKRIILIFFLATIVFTSCKQKESQTNSTSKTPVTVVLDWTPNTNHTGLYVALEKGYYEEEGLAVEIQQPPEGGGLALIAAGKGDFAISFQEEIANALTAETPLKVVAVAAIIQHNTSGILSEKSKNIVTPKDMENHNYATWDTPIEKAILKEIITKDNGDYSKVELIPSTVTDVITALKTNIDTIWVYYSLDGVGAKVKNLDTNFFYFKDMDPALDFYTPVLASSEKYLTENEETAKNFLKATAKGYEYAIENPEDAANILCELVPEIDKEITLASQKYLVNEYKAEVSDWGYIDKTRWDNFYTWLYEKNVITKKIDSGVGFTNDYLEIKK